MKISHKQFMQQLVGARYMDEIVWRQMQMERELWSMFAFDDSGATWLSVEDRKQPPSQPWIDKLMAWAVTELDWNKDVKNCLGYFEPEAWIVQ